MLAQGQYIVHGTISDAMTGETLLGATLFDTLTNEGTLANEYGFYSLRLDHQSAVLRCSYVGYAPWIHKISSAADTTINITLQPSASLDEVTVTTNNRQREFLSSQMSFHNINRMQIQNMPVLFGEVDMVKALQYLPGVSSGMEGTSGIYVRGGGADQNLILLDGIPVYNVNHLFGFFSVFNGDAVNSATIYKGGFPARYSGRLSSVIDVRMKEGNNQEFKGAFSIGLLSSKLMLEGPLIKDKTSFLISARRSYADLVSYPVQYFINKSSYSDSYLGFYFYDLNAKINHKFSDKSRLFLSAYLGKDAFYGNDFDNVVLPDNMEEYRLKSSTGFNWGNITSALRWNFIWTNNLFSDLSASYSVYKFRNFSTSESLFKFEDWIGTDVPEDRTFGIRSTEDLYYSGIKDLSLRANFSYIPSTDHYFRFGLKQTRYMFEPGVLTSSWDTESIGVYFQSGGADTVNSAEFTAYIEDDFRIGDRFKANVGLSTNLFLVDKVNYFSLEPRLSLRYSLSDRLTIKASYAKMSQNVHLLTNSTIGLPTDIWVPTTRDLAPERSWQVASGFKYRSKSLPYEASFEVFYKNMDNLIEYAEGAELLLIDEKWEDNIVAGEGTAYGTEFFVEKTEGRLTGSLAYTWSKNMRTFEEIDNGTAFPFKYDRRHDLSMLFNYRINEKVSMNAVWVYGSGIRTTIQDYTYVNPLDILVGVTPADITTENDDSYIRNYASRNGYQLPAYHRLDLGFSFEKQKKRVKRTWSFGAYNAYNRKNAFFIYSANSYISQGVYEKRIFQTTVFPIMPYFRYSISF